MDETYTSCTFMLVVHRCRLVLLPVSPRHTAQLQMPYSPSGTLSADSCDLQVDTQIWRQQHRAVADVSAPLTEPDLPELQLHCIFI